MTLRLNVGGKIFETTKDVLFKINYFKYMLEDTNIDLNNEIFINRSGHIFKHIIALAIDDNYKYPHKYKEELDFYDMKYTLSQLYYDSDIILECVNMMEKKIIKNCNDHVKNCNDWDCCMCIDNKCSRYDCNYECKNNFVCQDHEFICDYPIMNGDNIYYCDNYTSFITNDNTHYRCENHQ